MAGGGPSSPPRPSRTEGRSPNLHLPCRRQSLTNDAVVVLTLLFSSLPSTAGLAQDAPGPVNGEAAPAASAGEDTVGERYRHGVASFDYGDCGAAVTALEPIAIPGTLGDEKQLVDAYRILGVCYFQAGRTSDSVRSLEALLYIDPTYQLDPFRTPPPVSELFEERKAVIKRKLEQIEEEKRRQEPEPKAATVIIERERVIKTTPLATVFLPFGASQYVNGESGKSAIIGSIQGLTLAANLAATIAAVSIDASDGKIGTAPRGDIVQLQGFTIAWAASAVALGGFLVSYVYGVADAWWNRLPEGDVSTTERHHSVEGEDAKKLMRRLDGAE